MFIGIGRPDSLLIILLASSILQFAAAFLALRLIRFTGWRLSWLFIALAIAGMTLRRLLGLSEALPMQPTATDFVFEWIGLGVSALLLSGVAGIKPLFRSIRDAADKMARSEAMHRELVHNASSLIMRLSPRGEIAFVNEYACRFLGHSSRDLTGRPLGEVLLPATDSQGRDRTTLEGLFFGHLASSVRFECETLRKDGSMAWVGWACAPIRGQEGEVREYLCAGLDISDRKEKERLREDVQSILRHDLKSPLSCHHRLRRVSAIQREPDRRAARGPWRPWRIPGRACWR